MKRKFISLILLCMGFSMLAYSQVTEAEKNLRTVSADTTQGWKKRGGFCCQPGTDVPD